MNGSLHTPLAAMTTFAIGRFVLARLILSQVLISGAVALTASAIPYLIYIQARTKIGCNRSGIARFSAGLALYCLL